MVRGGLGWGESSGVFAEIHFHQFGTILVALCFPLPGLLYEPCMVAYLQVNLINFSYSSVYFPCQLSVCQLHNH